MDPVEFGNMLEEFQELGSDNQLAVIALLRNQDLPLGFDSSDDNISEVKEFVDLLVSQKFASRDAAEHASMTLDEAGNDDDGLDDEDIDEDDLPEDDEDDAD